MMENIFHFIHANGSPANVDKLQTILKPRRVVIFSNHVANIAKDNEWLETFGAQELKMSIVCVCE